MFKASNVHRYLFALFGIFFILGLYILFSLRFQVGDIYPPYSSLRSDPLGTKIFYTSLANMEELDVRRNYRPISQFVGNRNTTLFVIGLDSFSMDIIYTRTMNALSGLAASGGRLIITFYPSHSIHEPSATDENTDQVPKEAYNDKENSNTERPHERMMKTKDEKSGSLMEHLGVSLAINKEPEKDAAYLAATSGDRSLPSSITCYTTHYFSIHSNAWDVIYTQNEHPVIIERRYGTGTIILYADTFILSNEAMMSERHPKLLAWFVGHGKDIIFDEFHFGLRESKGIASLGRKYGLQGFLVVLLFVAGLFIWKNAIPFVPPDDASQTAGKGVAPERDHLDGLVGLLQRNIAPDDIMTICVKEWEKSVARDKDFLQTKVKKVRGMMHIPERNNNPVQTYRAIHKIISERKGL